MQKRWKCGNVDGRRMCCAMYGSESCCRSLRRDTCCLFPTYSHVPARLTCLLFLLTIIIIIYLFIFKSCLLLKINKKDTKNYFGGVIWGFLFFLFKYMVSWVTYDLVFYRDNDRINVNSLNLTQITHCLSVLIGCLLLPIWVYY